MESESQITREKAKLKTPEELEEDLKDYYKNVLPDSPQHKALYHIIALQQARFEVAEATARASKATTTELGELSEPFDEPVYVDTILSAREDEKGEADKVQTLFYKVITPQRERDPLVYGTVSKKTEDMVTLLDYANYSKGTFKPLVASLHVLRGINEAIVSRPKRQ